MKSSSIGENISPNLPVPARPPNPAPALLPAAGPTADRPPVRIDGGLQIPKTVADWAGKLLALPSNERAAALVIPRNELLELLQGLNALMLRGLILTELRNTALAQRRHLLQLREIGIIMSAPRPNALEQRAHLATAQLQLGRMPIGDLEHRYAVARLAQPNDPWVLFGSSTQQIQKLEAGQLLILANLQQGNLDCQMADAQLRLQAAKLVTVFASPYLFANYCCH